MTTATAKPRARRLPTAPLAEPRYALTPNGHAALDQWQRARARNQHRGWTPIGHDEAKKRP